jgi:hypothetical protein
MGLAVKVLRSKGHLSGLFAGEGHEKSAWNRQAWKMTSVKTYTYHCTYIVIYCHCTYMLLCIYVIVHTYINAIFHTSHHIGKYCTR